VSSVLDRPRLTVPTGGRDHILGPPNPLATLLEYGDYECPYCRAAHASLKRFLQATAGEVAFAYRHFPLTQVHPHAQQAAEAAEAAGAQGRFWQMHDLLFENQDRLTMSDLVRYAAELELDVERFVAELEARTYAQRVREDFLSGVRSGVNGTPTFFVNGIRHNGGYDPESLLAALEAAAS
jgi:protein-disulfide isomerase